MNGAVNSFRTLTLPLKNDSLTRIKSPEAKRGLLGASNAALGE